MPMTAMCFAFASFNGSFTVWQSMASSTIPSALAAMAWRTSGAYFDGFSAASYRSTFQPNAFAAATAASDGTWLLLAAWPAEITTMCLPLTAGRDVGSTGRLVPFSAFCVDAVAASSPELLLVLPPPDPPALVLEDELSSELQATMESATAATNAATRTTAVRV